jgi:hypothetical protein
MILKIISFSKIFHGKIYYKRKLPLTTNLKSSILNYSFLIILINRNPSDTGCFGKYADSVEKP